MDISGIDRGNLCLSLLATMSEGALIAAADGRVITCNPSAERILGKNSAELDSLPEIFRPAIGEDGTVIADEDHPVERALLSGETCLNVSLGVLRGNEELIWLCLNASPLHAEGAAGAILLTFRDVTTERNACANLQRSEQRLRSAFENSAIGMMEVGLDGKLTQANPAFCALMGYTEQELIGSSFIATIAAQPGSRLYTLCEELRTGEIGHFRIEKQSRRKSGEPTWLDLDMVLVRDKSGAPQYLFGQIQDITVRRVAETKLRSTERLYRTLFEQSPNPIFLVGAEPEVRGNIIALNEAARDLYGFGAGSLNGRNLIDINPCGETARLESSLAEAVQSGQKVFEITQTDRRGNVLELEISASLIAMYEERFLLLIGTDIRRRKAEERALKESLENAARASRSKSEFLANMSHEIRTPLNGIYGMLQLLRATHLDGEQQGWLDTAVNSSQTLLNIINDILDFSRIDAGKMEIVSRPFAVDALLDEIFQLFQIEVKRRGLNLERRIEETLPSRLEGDASRLRQILLNLVGNAVKFTPSGEIIISVRALSAGDETLVVEFSVRDTGVGIPETQLEAVFEPFTQADGSASRSFEGSGLGLSIVRRLVALMNGTVGLSSRLGKGTEVRVTVPLKSADIKPQPPQPREDPAAERVLRILLAEDNPVNQMAMGRMLEKAGHQVTYACNGQEALERLAQGEFDCILMDVQMPVMDGLEATRRARSLLAEVSRRQIPIIALTAHAMSGDRERFLAAGMDDYLPKPVDFTALEQTLARHSDLPG